MSQLWLTENNIIDAIELVPIDVIVERGVYVPKLLRADVSSLGIIMNIVGVFLEIFWNIFVKDILMLQVLMRLNQP